MNASTTCISLPVDWVSRILFLVVMFFIIGSAWVWKEHHYNRLVHLVMAAECLNRDLRNEASSLEMRLSQSTEYTTISRKARELGMIRHCDLPDTLWISDFSAESDNRSISTMAD